MFIKNVILDGFKSYAKRTEVSDFDPYFNAITGLNGSGKSNILDGICFLLGITNLSQVRANNLQELIFKSGQAGISKASVTVIFDNTEKKLSPLGYEDFDEITITRIVAMGGRTKYLINGCNATNSRIHDFFCSVHMNVNNPHFLIMQGRITKVLNMKPSEVLSMIEEATGTKMYESKRQTALNTIGKKEHKLGEIDRMLNDDITPTITKLKDERSSYLDYQKMSRELEHIKSICLASDYVTLKEKKVKLTTNCEIYNKEKQETFDLQAQLNTTLENIEIQINKLQTEMDRESGNELQICINKAKDASACEIRDSSKFQYAIDTLNSLNKQFKESKSKLSQLSDNMKNKNHSLLRSQSELLEAKVEKDRHQSALDAAVKQAQAATLGISDSGENAQTATELIISSRNRLVSLQSEHEKITMQINIYKKELVDKERELNKNDAEAASQQSVIKSKEKEIEHFTKLRDQLNYNEKLLLKNKDEKLHLANTCQSLKNSIEQFETKNPNLVFRYTDPEPSFDRSRVYGLVGSLFSVKDTEFTLAIESSAGAKLFNVIVDTDETTKKLIKGGNLRKRVTFVALNRIKANPISADMFNRAEKAVGLNQVWRASSLITCESTVQTAMDFIFGNTLICANSEVAKRLAYDKSIGSRCVTLQGDIFESTGTLTGGSRPTTNLLLNKLNELQEYKNKLHQTEVEISKLDKFIHSQQSNYNEFKKLSNEIDSRQHELQLILSKFKSSRQYLLAEEIDNLKTTTRELEHKNMELAENLITENALIKELEEKSKNEDSFKKEVLAKCELAVNTAKENLNSINAKSSSLERIVQNLQLELEEYEMEIKKFTANQEALTASIEEQNKIMHEAEKTMVETRKQLEYFESKIEELKTKMSECNRQMQNLNNVKTETNNKIFECQLKTKELSQNIINAKQQSQNIAIKIQEILKENEWLINEEKNFNSPGSPYNFNNVNIPELKDKLKWLETSVQKMSRTINTRAMNMLSQAEDKYNDLMRKKKIVENDRKKIELIIKDLDIKKNEALKLSWKKVNKDFGSIFSSLLPGACAKLCPIENKNILEGLEIKVAFGNSWKEGLNELSGGQRSLVALSLILSLLLFKPAPIYILDEVDAALDISHTQNIGTMLKSHFRKSQFIIVSLKDGMFSNANVLFKTKFVNGVSTISRMQQSSTHSNQDEANHSKFNYNPIITSSTT